jgi:DNA-binding GntR family transcriptional regulator
MSKKITPAAPGSAERTPLATKAYTALKAAISSRELQPRERLYEREIAARLNMSRTPVREAFQHLVRDGLAEIGRDGVFVRALTVTDVRAIEQANRGLQGLASELAASAGSEEDIVTLEQLMKSMESSAAKRDPEGWAAVDRQMRRHLLQMTGNEWVVKLVLQLEPLIERVHHISFRRRGRMGQSTREHRSIVDAIRSRDAQAARQAMLDHLLLVEQNVIGILAPVVGPWNKERS